MVRSDKSISRVVLAVLLGLVSVGAKDVAAQTETIPSATAIPVMFAQTLDAGKAKPGEIVTAKTTQVVLLPGGQVLQKGTTLVGHVVESTPFVFNPAPYAIQKPSVLSVHFDKIAAGGATLPVSLSLRAIADPVASQEASILHYRDETDSIGTRVLVGGNEFSPLESKVLSSTGDIVGFSRNQGVFARLIARDYEGGNSEIHCAATETEQSVGIFSATACGVYGLDAVFLSNNGANGDGTFALESSHQAVKLYARSTALLQVVGL